jgi:hypothetical protein
MLFFMTYGVLGDVMQYAKRRTVSSADLPPLSPGAGLRPRRACSSGIPA